MNINFSSECLSFIASLFIPLIFIQLEVLNRLLFLYKKLCLYIQIIGLKRAKFIAMLESDFVPTSQSEIICNDYFPNGRFHFTDAEINDQYENRNTKLGKKEIEEKIESQLIPFYRDLQKRIEKGIKNGTVRKQQMMIETKRKTIAEWFIEIYSPKRIHQAIELVNANMATDPSIHFIGDKIGILGYTCSNKEIDLELYKTDHFTFKVFKEIYKDKLNKSTFKDIILRLNNTSNYPEEKIILLRSLAFLFSSFGIDIIIEGTTCKNVKSLLISARSGKIERNGESLLHVPVNETFSLTDNENNNGYSVYNCVSRGIEEEIGISASEFKKEDIKFHDFAIVTDEGEIGFSAHVKLTKIPIEQAQLYPGQDKYIEIDELLQMPFPHAGILFSGIKWYKPWELLTKLPFLNPKKRILEKWFLNHHYQDKLALSWMSFTPLIFQRMILRNLNLSELFNTTVAFLLLTIITYKYWPTSDIYTYFNYASSIVITIIIVTRRRNKNRHKYSNLLPFIPQWSGNVRATQTTGKLPEDNVLANPNNGLSFGMLTDKATTEVHISDLRLTHNPYFSVRKAYSCKHFEIPISFYQMQHKKQGGEKLSFLLIDLTCKDIETMHLKLKVNYDKTHIISYSFITEELSFALSFQSDPDSGAKYKNYYKSSNGHDNQNVNYKFAKIPTEINDAYQLYDCFTYKGSYYWSCTPKTSLDNRSEAISYDLTPQNSNVKMFYSFIEERYNEKKIALKDEKEEDCFTIELKGHKVHLQQVINDFLSNSDNRRKTSDMDIFMLQFILIRKDIIIANTY